MIRTWQPWQRATGPRTAEGKAQSSRNAYKGGAGKRESEQFRALTSAVADLLKAHRKRLSEL